jgi:amino acid permease
VLAADELVAVSNTIKFRYDDGRTVLNWTVGENVDNAVWITAFMAVVIVINLFPVRVGIEHTVEIWLADVADSRFCFSSTASSNTCLDASK